MLKMFLALCGLVLALTLGACADTRPGANMAGPAGSEVARPNARQAGVLGR